MSAGFYKVDGGTVYYAPNRVFSPTTILRKEQKDTYTYPSDGWYWFDSLQQAEVFFTAKQQEYDIIVLRELETEKTASPFYNITFAQAEAYIQNNVTDLASAKTALKKMAKAILVLNKMVGA